MSTTPNESTTNVVFADATNLQLDEASFDALFAAEAKAVRGDNADAKKLAREIFKEEPAKEAPATTTISTESVTTEVTADAVPDTATSATDGADSTSNTNEPSVAEANAWLEALDPSVKTEVEKLIAEKAKLEHRVKSDEGRVAQYQRHYETQKRENQELLKRIQPQQNTGTNPTVAAKTATPSNTSNTATKEIPANIKAVLDADPEIGKIMLEQHEASERTRQELEARLNALQNEVIAPLHERYEDLRLHQELDLLEHEVQQATQGAVSAKEILKHPIWDDFKSVAPPAIKALANSANRFEVQTAISEYLNWITDPRVEEWANKKYGAPDTGATNTTATTTNTATATDPAKAAQAQRVKQEAERKSASNPVGSNNVARPTNRKPTEDEILSNPELAAKHFDEVFAAEYKKARGLK